MNKLEDLIIFVNDLVNDLKANEHSALRKCMENSGFPVSKMAPHLARIDMFEDIAKALTFLKEIINHLDVDVDYTDTDFNDIINGYYFKLEFDNDDDKDFQIADELYEWYENETYNDEYWREEYERNER